MHLANRLFFLICTSFVFGASNQSQNDDKLSQFVEKLHILTRLTNGIILEAGLMKGSIPSDDVISEFLHMGSIKIDDLLKLNSEKLDTIFYTFHNLSRDLSTLKEIELVEARFGVLDEIRKSAVKLGDLKNVPGQKEYQDNVTQLETVKIDEKKLENFFTDLDLLDERLTNLVTMKVADPKKPDDVNKQITDIQALVESLNAFSTEVTNFNETLLQLDDDLEVLKSFEQVETSFLDTFDGEMKLRQQYINESSSGAKIDLKLIDNSVQQWFNSSIVFKDSQGLVGPIQKLIKSRVDVQAWTRKFFPGFSHGLGDFQHLPKDSENENLKVLFSQTDSDWVSEHLSRSLIPISEFGKNVSEFDEFWKLISSQNSLDDMNSVVLSSEKIANHADKKDAVIAKMKLFEGCDLFSESLKSKAPSLDTIGSLKTAIADLKSAIKNWKSFDYLSETPDIKDLITKYQNLSKRLTKTDLNILKSVNRLKTVRGLITKLRKDLPDFKDSISRISDLIKKVSSFSIKDHLKSLEDSRYLSFYSCLKDTIGSKQDDGKVVLDVLKEIRQFGENSPNSKSQQALDVVGAVLNSLDSLKSLKTYGNAMRDITDTEAVALKNSMFDDSQNQLKKLVKSVEGLTKIKELSGKRADLEALLGDFSSIKTSADTNKAKLQKEESEGLEKVESLKTVLEGVLRKIDELNQKIEKLEVKDFESFAPILQAANEIPDVTENVETLVSALNALATIDPTIKGKTTDIVKSLSTLESLDLKFSIYEISSGIESLKSLDLFFVAFSRKIPPSPTEPPTTTIIPTTIPMIQPMTKTIRSTIANSIPVTRPLVQILNTTASSMPEWQIGLIVAICLIVAAAVILCILSYCRGWCCFKNKKVKSSKSSSSDNDPEIILPPVGPVSAEESLYIPPPSMYHPLPHLPPPPPPPSQSTMSKPKKESSVSINVATAQQGPNDFPQAQWTVEPTQENEPKTKTVEEAPKSKEVGSGSKETVSKGSTSKSKEDVKMKPSQEVM